MGKAKTCKICGTATDSGYVVHGGCLDDLIKDLERSRKKIADQAKKIEELDTIVKTYSDGTAELNMALNAILSAAIDVFGNGNELSIPAETVCKALASDVEVACTWSDDKSHYRITKCEKPKENGQSDEG